MKMTAKLQQLNSEYDGAYMNALNAGGGGVGVWLGARRQPTYLLRHKNDKNIVAFATFASVVWADEWLARHLEYEVVWKFEPEQEK